MSRYTGDDRRWTLDEIQEAWAKTNRDHVMRGREAFIAKLTRPAIHGSVPVKCDGVAKGELWLARYLKEGIHTNVRVLLPESLVKEMVKPIILDVWHGDMAWDKAEAALSAKIAHYTEHGDE